MFSPVYIKGSGFMDERVEGKTQTVDLRYPGTHLVPNALDVWLRVAHRESLALHKMSISDT